MNDILSGFKRVDLCHQPTALEEMPRLTKALGGPNLWIKRDDCTGLATGGNKTRKLEFLMAAALDASADMVVTQGAVQSNHVRQTAAAACKLGLDCYALLERRVPDKGADYEQTGNVLFDHMFNTQIEFRGPGLDMNSEALAVTDRLRGEGRNPYFIPGWRLKRDRGAGLCLYGAGIVATMRGAGPCAQAGCSGHGQRRHACRSCGRLSRDGMRHTDPWHQCPPARSGSD